MRKIVFTSLLLLDNSGLYAGTMGEVNKPHSMYAEINASLDWIRTNNTQIISLLPPFSDTYTGNQAYKVSGGFGVGAGIEREVNANLLWQLGLAANFNSAVQAHGVIVLFNDPNFDDFDYRYKVQSSRLVATGKLLGTYQQVFHPYVSGELGSAFNRSYGYTEIPRLATQPPKAPFKDNTLASFTWGVGVGVDMDISSNLRLGVGYQFSDFGRSCLGVSSAQATSETLTIVHLYDNQARVQLTALI